MVRLGAVNRRDPASGDGLTSRATTVFLVDDEPAVVRSLSRSLRMAGHQVRTFRSPHDFLADHDFATPGCAVLDFAMSGLSGPDLQDALTTSGNQRPIIFMSGSADVSSGVEAMKRGAVDYLTKPVNERELLAAVQCALEKDRRVRATSAELQTIGARLATLTPREREVFDRLVAGRRNKQIAGDLGTVERTIKAHRSSVMKKMGAGSLPDLVRMALQAENSIATASPATAALDSRSKS